MLRETIENHHLKIKPSLKFLDFVVQNTKNITNVPENIHLLQSCYKNQYMNCFLTLNDIKWIKLYLIQQQKIYIHVLLEEVDIELPEPKATPRNNELEARLKILQAHQDTRNYKKMTKSVDTIRKHLPEDTIAFQMKLINKQLIAVAQFIFSVIAGFAFGFIGVELIVGNLDFGFRLLLGIMCALIIALAEIYFLAKKLSEHYDDLLPRNMSKKLHQE